MTLPLTFGCQKVMTSWLAFLSDVETRAAADVSTMQLSGSCECRTGKAPNLSLVAQLV